MSYVNPNPLSTADILASWTGTKNGSYTMAGDGTMQPITGFTPAVYVGPTAPTGTVGEYIWFDTSAAPRIDIKYGY